MSFASTLNTFCSSLGCTNRELASRCGISPSALSRYRNGSRTPDLNSPIVGQLAHGIAELSRERNLLLLVNEDEVLRTLQLTIESAEPQASGFDYRLDSLFTAASMSNTTAAGLLGLDPSYVSRIRAGVRMPGDINAFVRRCVRIVVARCIERGTIEQLTGIVGPLPSAGVRSNVSYGSDIDVSMACEEVGNWLLGQTPVAQSTARTGHLLRILNEVDVNAWHDMAAAYVPEPISNEHAGGGHMKRGIGALRSATREFFTRSIDAGATEVTLLSDMPFAAMFASEKHYELLQATIAATAEQGIRVNVVHNLECSLSDSMQQIEFWVPLYLSGMVSGYYLRGMRARIYRKVNFTSSACVLSGEIVAGHFEDSWRFMSSDPEDVECLVSRTKHALELSTPHLRAFRADDPEQMAGLQVILDHVSDGVQGVEVLAGQYENLRVFVYPHDYAVIIRKGTPDVHIFVFNQQIGNSLHLLKQGE